MTIRTFLRVKTFFIVLLSLLILIGCEEETPNEPPPQDYPDYYPGGIGSTFKYSVVEKGSSQIELQGGYGGGGFVGTLGLSFNNFSIRNILNNQWRKNILIICNLPY